MGEMWVSRGRNRYNPLNLMQEHLFEPLLQVGKALVGGAGMQPDKVGTLAF